MYDKLADLPLLIDRVTCTQQSLAGATSFERITTHVLLHGRGQTGRGEDTGYAPDDQRRLPEHLEDISASLLGDWTFDSFSRRVGELDLHPSGPSLDDHPNYRRWALDSAALDLALRQSRTSLSAALGLPHQPVRFCVSMGLGTPPDTRRVLEWLEVHPGLEFKLDASREWSEEICSELAATGAVRVVDIKGQYTGDWIDNTPDPALYERLSRSFADAYLEDPFLDETTRAALGDGLRRVSWDAPIHGLDDVRHLAERPTAINIKPSRFGTVRELLRTISWCRDSGVPMYGGGQFELGWGRSQAQTIASLFYADAANDVAPVAWHTARPGDDVPLPDLEVPDGIGFGFDAVGGSPSETGS